ncbi:hypothetical protein B0F90DRAFT_1760916, partial [Multifurca ochricompacta]
MNGGARSTAITSKPHHLRCFFSSSSFSLTPPPLIPLFWPGPPRLSLSLGSASYYAGQALGFFFLTRHSVLFYIQIRG